MHIFIVNLARDTQKRQFMQAQLDKLNLKAEFFPAIYGKDLSDEALNECVHDYQNAYLTHGEIGCALSHIQIYEQIVAQNLSHALILEDDAILTDELPSVLTALEAHHTEAATAYQLGTLHRYIQPFSQPLNPSHKIHIATSGYGTHGYVINLAAAKQLAKHLLPIRYEADSWRQFQKHEIIRFRGVIPPVIYRADPNQEHSLLTDDRAKVSTLRKAYVEKNLKATLPLGKQLKWGCIKVISAPFIVKVPNSLA